MTEPQDHKPKKEKPPKPKVEKVDGGWEVTHRGVTVTILNEAFDDFEILEMLGVTDKRESLRVLPQLFRRLFGDASQKVLDALRDPKTGRVSTSAASAYFREVFAALNPES